MRSVIYGLILGVVLWAGLGQVGAQDAVPTAVPVAEDGTTVYTTMPGEIFSLLFMSTLYDICPEEVYKANRDLFESKESPDPKFIPALKNPSDIMSLTIPPHESCYTVITSPYKAEDLVQIEHDYNICIEEYKAARPGSEGHYTVYLRRDAPPCINEKGQRLVYHMTDDRTWIAGDYSSVPWIDAPADVTSLGYCLGDLRKSNHVMIPPVDDHSPIAYILGTRLFIPETTRKCEFISLGTYDSLYEFSQEHNVCMDVLLDTSGLDFPLAGWQSTQLLSIPLEMPPCYGELGQRLNVPQESVYHAQVGESFLDIARKHNICLDALWAANPIMDSWNNWRYELPEVIFIPVEKPCEFANTFTIRPRRRPLTLLDLAALTNICMNRLVDANPNWDVKVDYDYYAYQNTQIPSGEQVNLPDRPPCYHLTGDENFSQIQYLCYAVAVTPDADFTGHVPPVSSSRDTNLPYCYEITSNMTFVYENVRYSTYRKRGYDTFVTIGQCFDIDPEELLLANTQTIPEQARPYSSIYIPQPYNEDCWLLTTNDDEYYERYLLETYKAGYLIEGVYHVNYNDTLSSIGRTFGYPYQWIAEVNDLTDPDTIYYLQELKMPPYPSLYTLASIGGAGGSIVLVGAAIYGLRRRHMGKKKNS